MERTTSVVATTSLLLILAFFSSFFLTTCATLPNTKSLIREISYKDPIPEITGSHEALSPERRKTIIRQLEKQAASTDLLKRHLPLSEIIGQSHKSPNAVYPGISFSQACIGNRVKNGLMT